MAHGASIASRIDHTLLAPGATPEAVDRLCREAVEHGFHAVCVNGVFARRAAAALAGTDVAVATVVGFPLGAADPAVKLFEARRALADGARELDVVLWIGGLKAGLDEPVRDDVASVAGLARAEGATLKVILETSLLDDGEKARGCALVREAGADFVKTSTGFARGGATVADVVLLRRVAGGGLRVKAAGGIRTLADARALLEAGADRLGCSASVAIVAEERGG